MSYRVLWTPVAEQQFEDILSQSRIQSEITEAAKSIDAQLLIDPFGVGESRYDDVRICFAKPLGVEYQVLEDVRTVVVNGVWRIGRSTRG